MLSNSRTPTENAPIHAFAYVTAEKSSIYRSIMAIFVHAKGNFTLSLRPQEILASDLGLQSLQDGAFNESFKQFDESEIETALKQLCAWGNVEAHPDTSDVASIEEFYRPRSIYQITQEGEAAELALQTYFSALEQEGELQVAALTDIQSLLSQLLQFSCETPSDAFSVSSPLSTQAPSPDPSPETNKDTSPNTGPNTGQDTNKDTSQYTNQDPAKIHLTLTSLKNRFEALTLRAQGFMRGLQRNLDMPVDDYSIFFAYKDLLIGYLERFIREMVLLTPSITHLILKIEDAGLHELLKQASKRELADALGATESDFERTLNQWHLTWKGFRSWFIGSKGTLSQSELLRNQARRAIPALLTLVQRINDRRVNRSDRSADFRTLARWFAEAETDNQVNRLWQAAFGLAPSRHLSIDQATLDVRDLSPIPPTTSWLDAPPIRISPRLKKTGSFQRKGAPSSIRDRSKEKEYLALALAEENQQILEAHHRLATQGKIRLSHLEILSPAEFDLFLDLLGNVLSQKRNPLDVLEAQSTDGSIRIKMEPIENAERVEIMTQNGVLTGLDHFIEIQSDWISENYRNIKER